MRGTGADEGDRGGPSQPLAGSLPDHPPAAPSQGGAGGRVARVAIAWAAGLALLLWVTRGVAWRDLGGSLGSAPASAWAAAVLGLWGSYLLRALRIHAELRRRHPVSVARCLEVMLLHNSAVNLLPMRGGEAAYPWLVHRRVGVPLAHAAASLVWMRVQDALVLALLALALWPGLPLEARALGAAAVVLGTALGLALLERLARTAPAAAAPRPVRAVYGALHALALAPRHGVVGWLCCAGSWTLKLAALGGLLGSLAGLPLLAAVTGALGGELAGVLPVQGPAGFGTYEAGVYLAASMRAAASPSIAAAAVAVHLVSLATAVAAGAAAYAVSQRRAAAAIPGP
jgi:uncharacterized membrane protein YbhN (UPF0104 family)